MAAVLGQMDASKHENSCISTYTQDKYMINLVDFFICAANFAARGKLDYESTADLVSFHAE